MREELIDRLAALAHEQWAGWTTWMLEKIDQAHPSGETFRERWRRQIATAYADLSDAEKESDRVEARKVLALLDAWRDEVLAR